MSTQATASKPTKSRYFAQNGSPMTFKWIRPMPDNGYLGEVSFGTFQNKPIQVFDAQGGGAKHDTDWGYQAQDGSFLCRMLVSPDQNRITFTKNKKGHWPNITVFGFPFQEGREEDRDPIPAEN